MTLIFAPYWPLSSNVETKCSVLLLETAFCPDFNSVIEPQAIVVPETTGFEADEPDDGDPFDEEAQRAEFGGIDFFVQAAMKAFNIAAAKQTLAQKNQSIVNYKPTWTAETTIRLVEVPIGQQVDRFNLLVESSINWVWSSGL